MKKIIFIDDNFADIKETYYLICKIIYGKNFEVLYFTEPEYAIDFVNSIDTAIIILDIMFIGDGLFKGGFKRGIDAYKDFKRTNPTIPIVILTQLERDKDIDFATIDLINNNGDIFLEKIATSPKELVININKLL